MSWQRLVHQSFRGPHHAYAHAEHSPNSSCREKKNKAKHKRTYPSGTSGMHRLWVLKQLLAISKESTQKHKNKMSSLSTNTCSRKSNTAWRSLLLTQWHIPSRQAAVQCLVNSIKHSSKYEYSPKNICTPQKVTVVNKLLLRPVSKNKKRRENSTPEWTLATIARSSRPGETWCLCAIHSSVAKIIHIYRFGILGGLHHLQHLFRSIPSVLSTRCHNIRGRCVLRPQPISLEFGTFCNSLFGDEMDGVSKFKRTETWHCKVVLSAFQVLFPQRASSQFLTKHIGKVAPTYCTSKHVWGRWKHACTNTAKHSSDFPRVASAIFMETKM